MTLKVAINGYGASGATSCGRTTKRARNTTSKLSRSNDLGDARINAHLTRHDTVHGPFWRT